MSKTSVLQFSTMASISKKKYYDNKAIQCNLIGKRLEIKKSYITNDIIDDITKSDKFYEIEYNKLLEKEEIKLCSNTVSIKTNIEFNLDNLTGITPFSHKIYDVKNSIAFSFNSEKFGKVGGRIFTNGTILFSCLKYYWEETLLQNLLSSIFSAHNSLIPKNYPVIKSYKDKEISESNFNYLILSHENMFSVTFDIFLIDYNKLPLIFNTGTKFSLFEASTMHIQDYKIIECKNQMKCGTGYYIKLIYSQQSIITFTIYDKGTILVRAKTDIEQINIACDHFISIINHFKPMIKKSTN